LQQAGELAFAPVEVSSERPSLGGDPTEFRLQQVALAGQTAQSPVGRRNRGLRLAERIRGLRTRPRCGIELLLEPLDALAQITQLVLLWLLGFEILYTSSECGDK